MNDSSSRDTDELVPLWVREGPDPGPSKSTSGHAFYAVTYVMGAGFAKDVFDIVSRETMTRAAKDFFLDLSILFQELLYRGRESVGANSAPLLGDFLRVLGRIESCIRHHEASVVELYPIISGIAENNRSEHIGGDEYSEALSYKRASNSTQSDEDPALAKYNIEVEPEEFFALMFECLWRSSLADLILSALENCEEVFPDLSYEYKLAQHYKTYIDDLPITASIARDRELFQFPDKSSDYMTFELPEYSANDGTVDDALEYFGS